MLRDVDRREDRRALAFLALGLGIAALMVVLAVWAGATMVGSFHYGP